MVVVMMAQQYIQSVSTKWLLSLLQDSFFDGSRFWLLGGVQRYYCCLLNRMVLCIETAAGRELY